MDTNIVVVFHPFEIEQEVMVYQCGECVNQTRPALKNIVNTICALENQYKASRINLCGTPSFVNKYIKDLKMNFSLNKDNPIIEIIPR